MKFSLFLFGFISEHSLLDVTMLGKKNFGDLFGINPPCVQCNDPSLSIVFVVDDTSSMGGEIASVKTEILRIVNNAVYTSREPADYVLSTFNDPGKHISPVT